MTNELPVNNQAPDFALKDQSGRLVKLEDLTRHRYTVMFFYSKDDTSG